MEMLEAGGAGDICGGVYRSQMCQEGPGNPGKRCHFPCTWGLETTFKAAGHLSCGGKTERCRIEKSVILIIIIMCFFLFFGHTR